MKRTKIGRERCDRCMKWVEPGQLFTLPETLYTLLKGDNEFSVCEQCIEKYSIEQWKSWIPKARDKGLSFKDWRGK